MTEHEQGTSQSIQPKVKKEHNAQKSFEENGKVKSFDESGKFRRFDSDLYNGASRSSLGVTNSISHSSYNSANEVMPELLDTELIPFPQELQFDLYDYDPHGMNGQPATVSPNPFFQTHFSLRTHSQAVQARVTGSACYLSRGSNVSASFSSTLKSPLELATCGTPSPSQISPPPSFSQRTSSPW